MVVFQAKDVEMRGFRLIIGLKIFGLNQSHAGSVRFENRGLAISIASPYKRGGYVGQSWRDAKGRGGQGPE